MPGQRLVRTARRQAEAGREVAGPADISAVGAQAEAMLPHQQHQQKGGGRNQAFRRGAQGKGRAEPAPAEGEAASAAAGGEAAAAAEGGGPPRCCWAPCSCKHIMQCR